MPSRTRRHAPGLILTLAALALAPPARAQECPYLPNGAVGSAARDRIRVEQLQGSADATSLLFQRPSDDLGRSTCADGVQPAPVEARALFLGGYPDDRDDGPLWSGRGFSGAVTLGAVARWGALSAAVAPTLGWSQNRDYRRRLASVPGVSPDADPFLAPTIDLPTRMGAGGWSVLDPGESFVRADVGPVAFGFSTEGLWWGPGFRDALVLTNTGPGIPHAFAGTREPLDIWIGRLEAKLVLGRLSTSRQFAADGRVGHTVFRGAAIGFEPAFAPGLFVGFAHGSIATEQGTIVTSALKHLVSRGAGPPDGSQNSLASIMARWVLPAARLELYGEFGRDDTAAVIATLMEPERSSAYAFGMQKLFTLGRREFRLQFEDVNTFEVPAVNAPPPGVPVFYTHPDDTFYAHRGQSLGAGVGPAARAQFLAVDLLTGPSRVGVYAERRLRNMRAFYDSFARLKGRDMELGTGVRQVLSRGAWDVEWQAGLAHRWNAEFLGSAWQPSVRANLTWWPGRHVVAATGSGPLAADPARGSGAAD